MQSVINKRQGDRIVERYKRGVKMVAKVKSFEKHGHAAKYRMSLAQGIGKFFRGIGLVIRAMFGRKYKWLSDKPYVYDGPARPKQPHPHTFGAYMRWRKRKVA